MKNKKNYAPTRRSFLKNTTYMGTGLAAGMFFSPSGYTQEKQKRPNILFAMADDWSWPHASAYGDEVIKTPNFDRVAKEGILFSNTYAAAPQCAPNRASILTGRNIWQNEEAGTHGSYFPKKFSVYPDLLEDSGYFVGYTGKPWGPGNWKVPGWERNPAGKSFNRKKNESVPAGGIRKNCDYAANFRDFLQTRPEDKPFCFWYGASEPHRGYEKGSGQKAGKDPDKVKVPPFLPDTPEVRNDILDYYVEVEWFDHHLGEMLKTLEEIGELDNTLVVVTSDNGMPFPRAKANLYEYGVHMPMAIRWPEKIKAGRVVDDFISSIDFAPTFLEAAGLEPHPQMSGKSFLPLLTSDQEGLIEDHRNDVTFGRERHSHARYDNWGYPSRAIRMQDFLYIWNAKPDRWPAGQPDHYYDIDGAPTKSFMQEHKDDPEIKPLFELAFGKRPEEELYKVTEDPGCMNNLAQESDYQTIKEELKEQLMLVLKEQKDPRVTDNGDIFESYPRFNTMRPHLGGFAERGEYNPKYQQ